MDGNRDSIIMDGNTAAALGCVYAGATVAAWYPITPSTSLVDAFSQLCEKLPTIDGLCGRAFKGSRGRFTPDVHISTTAHTQAEG
jgi:2-oxoglutarate ferredoxin oxidoreductase subunit alpha